MSGCLSLYGSWPLYEAAMNGGSPHAISVSPCWSLDMFWMPAPGTTLMLNEASFDLISSTNPPACEYQPPPTWPAVHVRFFCSAVAVSAGTSSASAAAITIVLLMTPPPCSPSPALVQCRLVHVHAEPGAVEREDGAVGVRHRPAHHVALEQQRAEQLTPPRHRRRRQRDLQVGGGAERRLDHAADVAGHPRRLRDARDGHGAQDAGRLRELERQDRHAAEPRDGERVVLAAARLVGHDRLRRAPRELRHAVEVPLRQRLLDEIEAVRLERAHRGERGRAIPALVGVHAQRDTGADRLADASHALHVHAQGMGGRLDLEDAMTERDFLARLLELGLGAADGERPRQRHAVAHAAAEQPMDGHAEGAPVEIPERHLHRRARASTTCTDSADSSLHVGP